MNLRPIYSSHLYVPPLESKGLPANIGATMHLSQQLVVGGKVVDERAVEAQPPHQGAHLCLQATTTVHFWSKGFWNAEVFPQNNHVYLQKHEQTGISSTLSSNSILFYFPNKKYKIKLN